MSRPALAASRSADIIDFLACFPGRGFTLSEIVKGTGINLASCHAVLNVLMERGYVTRCPRQKSFRLGPALYAAGQVAMASQPLLARAQAAAAMLRDELGIPSLVSTVIGDEILGVISCDTDDGRSAGLNVGERMPLVPPLGASFLAWSGDDEIDAWLHRAGTGIDGEMIDYWRDGLAKIRERSFQVELRAPQSSQMAAQMEEMAAGSEATRYKGELLKLVRSWGRHPMQPDRIEPSCEYDLILIAAPVFDRDGRCIYSLCLGGFAGPIGGDEVQTLGNRLVAASLQIMQADRARD
ncbi:MAG: helix-turn-helix domain-containing protein [Novosphingobium sp.]|nr:helix-turn-helix domain-containing protein [Novosphingobium sp.]MCP5402183.1 helix-turn-helix domain-containing protein [Novosphingobium sp.]